MKLRTIGFAVGFFALGALQVVLAADPPNPIGFPKKAGPGGIGVYRVWFEDGTWPVRTSTENSEGKKDKLLVFAGSVRGDAKLTVEGVKLEKGNGKTSDRLVPHADGKGFDFRFATYGATDQADFKVDARGKTLKFTFQLDGEKAQTTRIFIGSESQHPDKSEFSLPAAPKK